MSRRLMFIFILLTTAILIAGQSSNTFAQKGNKGGGGGGYTVQPLDTNQGAAYDIRVHANFAEVVGDVRPNSAKAHYWRLDTNGNVTKSVDLTLPELTNGSEARGINWDGVIVGSFGTGEGSSFTGRPLAWASDTEIPIELPVPAGDVLYSGALHINDNWLVVGWVTWKDYTYSLVGWQLDLDNSGTLVCLDAIEIASGDDIGSGGLNNQGYFANTLNGFAWCWRVVWNPLLGEAGGLEVVYGEQQLEVYSTANGINEAGTVCGTYLNPSTGRKEGYAYEMNGAFHRLNVSVGRKETAYADAMAINDASPVQVAGEADIWRGNTPVGSPSVLWDLNGGMTTLPLDDFSSTLTIKPIFALENNGWMVGSAELINRNEYLPFLLKPR